MAAVTPATDFNLQQPGPHILVLDFTTAEPATLQFTEVELLNNDIEELQVGKCSTCGVLPQFENEPVFYKASDELLDFAFKAFSAYCKGKGLSDTELTLNG